jgi:hypothetical protein
MLAGPDVCPRCVRIAARQSSSQIEAGHLQLERLYKMVTATFVQRDSTRLDANHESVHVVWPTCMIDHIDVIATASLKLAYSRCCFQRNKHINTVYFSLE